MDPERPTANRVVVRGGKIEAVGLGPADEAERRDGRVIDLEGRTILPGFVDAHLHLSQLAREESFLDLSGARTLDQLCARIEEGLGGGTGGEWRRGRGLPGALANEAARTAGGVFPGTAGPVPVLLGTEDLHAAVVNRRGLEWLEAEGVLSGLPASCVVRSGDGAVLRERAAFAAARAVDRVRGPVEEEALARTVSRLNRRGVTSVFTFERSDDAGVIARSPSCGRGLCVAVGFYGEDVDALPGDEDGARRAVGLKIFLDGALGSRSALLIEPYADTGTRGIEATPASRRLELGRVAVRRGLPVCLHAIGDAAARVAIDLLEEIGPLDPALSPRHRVEHVQLLRPEELRRWERIGGIACLQPLHLVVDQAAAECAWGERCRYAYPQRRLLERGIRLAFGSDAPAGESDPLEAIRVAVTRRTASGASAERSWSMRERIDTEAAVAAHTRGAAFSSGLATGCIRAGLRADMVILSHDPFASEADLMRTEVVATVSGGEIVVGRERLERIVYP